MTDRPIPITRHISLIYRFAQRFFTAHLRGFPLESGQLPLLLQLYRHPGVTQEQLSQRVALDKGTTARGVALLLQNGLIERREDPGDRRAYRLSPTPAALALEEELFSIADELQAVLFQGMDEAERRQTADLVLRMARNLAGYFDDHPNCTSRRPAREARETEERNPIS